MQPSNELTPLRSMGGGSLCEGSNLGRVSNDERLSSGLTLFVLTLVTSCFEVWGSRERMVLEWGRTKTALACARLGGGVLEDKDRVRDNDSGSLECDAPS